MSSKVHNKKRNVGLLYEFLVRAASGAVIEGDTQKSAAALRILKKHFAPGTPLHREFKLFNSLMKVEISSSAVAGTILREAREAARDYDNERLQRAKTGLINEINKTLDDPTFWDAPIANYRVYATIGTLISEWRQQTGRVDIQRLAEYEDNLVKWLTEKKEAVPVISSKPADGTEKLALRIALKKFNEKYTGLLPEQKDIIRQWALSQHSGKSESIIRALKEVKDSTLQAIERTSNDDDLENLNRDLVEARNMIRGETLETVDDDVIKRFMLYSKLRAELVTKGGEK